MVMRGTPVRFVRSIHRPAGVVVPAGHAGVICTVIDHDFLIVRLDTPVPGTNPPGGLVMFDGADGQSEFDGACKVVSV